MIPYDDYKESPYSQIFENCLEQTQTNRYEELEKLDLLARECVQAGVPLDEAIQLCKDQSTNDWNEIESAFKENYDHFKSEFGLSAEVYGNTMVTEADIDKLEKKPEKSTIVNSDIIDLLPPLLTEIVDLGNNDFEKDMYLLSSLVVFGSLFKEVTGNYKGKKVYLNLLLLVQAPAASGKSSLLNVKSILKPFILAAEEVYNIELKQNERLPRAKKPILNLPLVPANVTSAGLTQLLSENDGSGLMFESESLTMILTNNTEHGNYTDILLKASENELLDSFRKGNTERFIIKEPKLSIVFSGVPSQSKRFFGSSENGLFSRFLTYRVNHQSKWRYTDISNSERNVLKIFESIGNRLFKTINSMTHKTHLEFSQDQWNIFDQEFENLLVKYSHRYGQAFDAVTYRLGQHTFKIICILTLIRNVDKINSEFNFTVLNKDIQLALLIGKKLIDHSAEIFKTIATVTCTFKNKRQEIFFESLPIRFKREKYMEICTDQGIPIKTADKWIYTWVEKLILNRENQGMYSKRMKD